jgi:omega-6 fatty acid desaturase (delta-12 desaturase)
LDGAASAAPFVSHYTEAVPDMTLEAASGLQAAVAHFAAPTVKRSLWQLVTSLGLFLAACAAMYLTYPISYPLTLALAVPAGLMLVRVFIVQHDCGHDAFFASRRANALVGVVCSLFTFAPYLHWRRQHARHHGTWNNLDRRQSGADIYSSCLTVREYRALTPWRRFLYRLTRHPAIANLLLPPLVFMLLYRVPFDTPPGWRRERRGVYLTNLAIAALLVAGGLLLGFRAVLLVQAPIIAVASIVGVWLFSVQHRFDGALWARQDAWTATSAAVAGSSYLRMPRLMHWLTGNIGFHHIHHLDQRVPNYRLQQCHQAVPALAAVPALGLAGSMRALKLALWDEDRDRLVGFADVRRSMACGVP